MSFKPWRCLDLGKMSFLGHFSRPCQIGKPIAHTLDCNFSAIECPGLKISFLGLNYVLAYYYAYSITQRYQFDVLRQKIPPIGTSIGRFLVFLIKIQRKFDQFSVENVI